MTEKFWPHIYVFFKAVLSRALYVWQNGNVLNSSLLYSGVLLCFLNHLAPGNHHPWAFYIKPGSYCLSLGLTPSACTISCLTDFCRCRRYGSFLHVPLLPLFILLMLLFKLATYDLADPHMVDLLPQKLPSLLLTEVCAPISLQRNFNMSYVVNKCFV